jgi:SOS-response transcriptional repressor LexA
MDLDTPGKRLKWARQQRGHRKQNAFAAEFAFNRTVLNLEESGTREITAAHARDYGRALGLSPEWLMEGKGNIWTTAPLVGYVGAGAEIYPIDDSDMGGGLEEVDAPPGDSRPMVAVMVKGDSMRPAYLDGDLLFYHRDYEFLEEECVRQECVVKVRNGPTLLKTIMRGTKPKRWTLVSYNADALEDREIEWAAPVGWVDKRHRLRRDQS